MFDTLTTAISGLNNAVSRIANAASTIVKTTSTRNISEKTADSVSASPKDVVALSAPAQEDLDSSLIELKSAEIAYKVNASVIAAVKENDQKLLDTLA